MCVCVRVYYVPCALIVCCQKDKVMCVCVCVYVCVCVCQPCSPCALIVRCQEDVVCALCPVPVWVVLFDPSFCL